MAVVREPVEQSRRQLGVAEDGGPFREAQVRRDDQARLLVELAHEVEQQRTAGLAERQVAELVEDHEIRVHHAQTLAPSWRIASVPSRDSADSRSARE
jgi:hypothetical protein